MNLDPTIVNAGIWIPIADNTLLSSGFRGDLANTFHALIKIDSKGDYGFIVNGWGWTGWPPTLASPAPVSMALFFPDTNGNLQINTSKYIADPLTNGSGSAIVADFNEDGIQDIVLLAHNESPFVPMSSVAWLSNSIGSFTKITLNDLVMAHDAELVYIDGKPAIASATFNTLVKSGALLNPIYTFQNGGFVISTPPNLSSQPGMSSTIVDSGEKAGLVLLKGDYPIWNSEYSNISWGISVFAFNGKDMTSTTPIQTIVPYLSTLTEFKNFPAEIGGPGVTHTYRLWVEDLNNDGKQDVLAGESMWSQTTSNFPSILQVLINKGDGTFVDQTATLNSNMSFYNAEMDYNPNFIDLDNSGIKTYLFSGSTSWSSISRQSDYVLLNDGTGKLYVALHDQFTNLGHKVYLFLNKYYNETSTPPRFIAIPQLDGSINFVAEVRIDTYNAIANIWQNAYQYVNVPVNYNPTTDFKDDIEIADRNHSMLMRTWAGNDMFSDKNANISPAHINGGLGYDTCKYGGVRSDYIVTQNSDNSISVIGKGLKDTLVDIERLVFSDKIIQFNNPLTGGVTITGTPTQNQTLTASNTLTDMDGLGSISYSWLRDDVAITNATQSNYTLTQTDVGKKITVKASYTDNAGTAESVISIATSSVSNVNDAPKGDVIITGTSTQNQTLTAINTLTDLDGLGTISYQWLSNNKEISNASQSTYKLAQSDVGNVISVKCSYTDGFGSKETVTSAATAKIENVNDALTGNVSISGLAAQGQTLTIVNTLADLDGLGTIKYQWLGNGAVIARATKTSYVLGSSDAGKTISVKASYTDLLGTSESVTSQPTDAVISTKPSKGNDVLTGNAKNDTLSALAGNDILTGGLGADKLTGGLGADIFKYTSIDDSGITVKTRDIITDFKHSENDKIDLSAIDANSVLSSDQSFIYIGNIPFGANATGQLRLDPKTGILYGSTNADSAPEFSTLLIGVKALVVDDFVL